MERDRLISELPNGLATALRLHEAGEPDSAVAAALAVPPESVPVLLQVAMAKLDNLIAGADAAEGAHPGAACTDPGTPTPRNQ